MSNRRIFKRFLQKLGGYYLIPHELLHVLAYRIIGKSCEYQWGSYHVQSSAKRTRREKLFILLFPTVVSLALGFFFHLLWAGSLLFIVRTPLERYFFVDGPTWHITLPVIATVFILYSGNGYGDVINAYRLLLREDESKHDSPKPHQQARVS